MDKNNVSGKVATFIGSTPNVGTTVISFGLAARLAEHVEQNIGYLCLNLKSSKLHRYLGITNPERSLCKLKTELSSQMLTSKQLLQYCTNVTRKSNFYVLFGNMQREQAEFFKPEEVEHLIRIAKATFDFCIIEVNAYWDNASTITAMQQTDHLYMVTTNQPAHFSEDTYRWKDKLLPLLHIRRDPCMQLILTQTKAEDLFQKKDVLQSTELPVMSQLPYIPSIQQMLDSGQLLSWVVGNTMFTEFMKPIFRQWTHLYKFNLNPSEQQSKKIKTLIAKWEGKLWGTP